MKLMDGRTNLDAHFGPGDDFGDYCGAALAALVKQFPDPDTHIFLFVNVGARATYMTHQMDGSAVASMHLQALSSMFADPSLPAQAVDFMLDEFTRRMLGIRNDKVRGRKP